MADSSMSLVVIEPVPDPAALAMVAFLAGYSGRTREAYELDLRQFHTWCQARDLALLDVSRSHIELFARDLEEAGKARATISRRLSTIAGFYRYAEEEDLIGRSPAAHVPRPRLDYESHAIGLDRNELGALLVQAGLGTKVEHALICLLGLNGLHISEALNADLDDLAEIRGHRTLTVVARAARPRPSRSPRAPPGPSTSPSANDARARSW